MNAQEIIDFIASAPKKTPVKLYVRERCGMHLDWGSAHVYGGREGKIVFGEWAELSAIIQKNAECIEYLDVEADRRNSAVPLLDVRGVNARIEPGAIIRDRVEIGDGAVIMMGAIINIGALLAILGLIFVESLPALSWEFLTEPPRNMMSEGGIWPCLVGTFFLSAGALVIALPLGVASAVYLHEYGGSSAWVTLTRLSIANLAGVPSIVFGLFGLTFFVVFCGFDVSLLSGILTLSVLSLPVIINTTEAALSQVPQDWREASLALGASRRETIMKVVLPNALPGILTGAILALSRVAGETAAIMYTGSVYFTPKTGVSLFEPVMALPYHVYVMATSGTNIEATRPLQYGTALVLVALVLVMSLAAILLRERRRSQF